MTMERRKIPVKPWDAVIFLLALASIGFFAFKAYFKPMEITQVLIEGQNQSWTFPLDAEETVNVKGPLGTTVVRIHGNQAWVESSPCDNKICVSAGLLHRSGEFASCLPNKVLVMVKGSDVPGDIDGAVR